MARRNSLHDCTTAIEALQWILEGWDVIHVRTRQDDHWETVPLSGVHDERSISRYVREMLNQWERSTKARELSAVPAVETSAGPTEAQARLPLTGSG